MHSSKEISSIIRNHVKKCCNKESSYCFRPVPMIAAFHTPVEAREALMPSGPAIQDPASTCGI